MATLPYRLKRLLVEMLEKITSGNATMEDLDKMEKLCYYIKNNSLCGLGQTAPNPVLSTLRYFKDEYIAHVKDKRCPAGVCQDLLIQDHRPQVGGLYSPAQEAVLSEQSRVLSKQPHSIDTTNVSSAVLVWLSVSSVQLLRNDPV